MQDCEVKLFDLKDFFRTFVFGFCDSKVQVTQKLDYLCYEPSLDCVIFCNDVLELSSQSNLLTVLTPNGLFTTSRLEALNKVHERVIVSLHDCLSDHCKNTITVYAGRAAKSSHPLANKHLVGAAMGKQKSAVSVIEINYWNHF